MAAIPCLPRVTSRGSFGHTAMKPILLLPLAVALFTTVGSASAAETLFADDFRGKLGAGWSWVREHREAWRVTGRGLEVRVEPGNMWGGGNDARNLLVRPAPDTVAGPVEFAVTFENRPTHQYEQADLTWYYDDSHMVKLGQELVDGKLSIVMGREEKDRTRTIAIILLDTAKVRLRLTVSGNEIHGEFRPEGASEWREAGKCDLPAPADARPKIALQFYQGPPDAEHWVKVTEFRVVRVSGSAPAKSAASGKAEAAN